MDNRGLTYRRAEPRDMEKLIDLTIQSFNGFNGRSFLESVFDISRTEFRDIVQTLFESNIPNNEYHTESYYVLEYEGDLIACLAGWKEGLDDIESERLLSSVVLQYVGIERWQERREVIEKASVLNIPREAGKIEIESMYLKKEFRGTSAFFKIYYRTVDNLFQKFPECDTVQSRFFQSNPLAIRIAKHIGYEIVNQSSFDVAPINKFFPNEGLVMTELKRDIFYSKNKIKSR